MSVAYFWAKSVVSTNKRKENVSNLKRALLLEKIVKKIRK